MKADFRRRVNLESAYQVVGIELADHVIIAGLGSTSFRALGLISGGRMPVTFSA